MVGGYGVFGLSTVISTTVSDLPTHGYIYIEFTFFIGDSWDNEIFYMYVDDVQVKSQNY